MFVRLPPPQKGCFLGHVLLRDVCKWVVLSGENAGAQLEGKSLPLSFQNVLNYVGEVFFICSIQLMLCTKVMWPAVSQTECHISSQYYSFGH